MGKILAIKGHPTRGNEVIELLEMIGGINDVNHPSTGIREDFYYIIDTFGEINYDDCLIEDEAVFFSLDDFYKKYPYKVGYWVRIPEYESEVRISKMIWNGYNSEYMVYRNDEEEWYTTEELNNYNSVEDIVNNEVNLEIAEMSKNITLNNLYKAGMESCKGTEYEGYENIKKVAYLSINDKDYADEIEINLGDDYEYKFEMNRLYILKKNPVYPKTYEECCDKTNFKGGFKEMLLSDDEYSLYISFIRLKRCRDAYWKIAGEQMGLGKPWEPDWNGTWEEGSAIKYVIYNTGTYIVKEKKSSPHFILTFPTEEMRDAFYENFKDLIEQCKELL